MSHIIDFLNENKIAHSFFEHIPVYTCEEAKKHLSHIPGVATKNLFLKNKEGSAFFVVSVHEEKRVQIKSLQAILNTSKLSFAKAEELKELLLLEPGSVTMLSVINDKAQKVRFIIDKELISINKPFQMHPLVNSATVVINCENLQKFFSLLEREIEYLDVPSC
jgi:Ala-tRNA(Pro) deacylase